MAKKVKKTKKRAVKKAKTKKKGKKKQLLVRGAVKAPLFLFNKKK